MDKDPSSPSPLIAGLTGRCPRCGEGQLFRSGWLSLRPREQCTSCGLDFAYVDTGDGPAVFAIMLLGLAMLGVALVVEFRYQPPLWFHLVLFTPVTLLGAVMILRPLKGLLIALQYHHKAEQGRLDR